jgi:hypothetical protein
MAYSSILKIETARSSETSVNFCHTIRLHISEYILYGRHHSYLEDNVPHSRREQVEGRLVYAATSPTAVLRVKAKQSLAGASVKLSEAYL